MFRILEATLPVVGGAIVGLALGLSVGAWSGNRAGVGGWSVLDRSIDGGVAVRVVEVTIAVWLLIFVALGLDEVTPLLRRRRPAARAARRADFEVRLAESVRKAVQPTDEEVRRLME